MSNSTTNLDLISAGQAQKEVTANAMFDAASPAMLFGRRASTTVALTWGYYGGTMTVSGAPAQIANGTVALTASATNYVEVTTAGVVSANTTAFTSGRKALYTVVTGTATVTSYTDQRTSSGGGGAAVDITNTPAGNIAATNVQAALNELDAEKALLAGSSTQNFSAKILTTSADASIFGVTVGRGGGGVVDNTVTGSLALSVNTGPGNTAYGYSSMYSTTSGSYNTAAGSYALYANTIGYNIAAFGSSSLGLNITGNNLAAFGESCLFSNTSGSGNSALGDSCLSDSGTGSNNTAVGFNAGLGITTGSGNTIIGANVGGLAANLTNNIIIADGAGNQRINVDSAGNVKMAATIATAGYTVATLPAGTVGQRAYVTDALLPTYNAALTGGGAATVPVFRNATVWVTA